MERLVRNVCAASATAARERRKKGGQLTGETKVGTKYSCSSRLLGFSRRKSRWIIYYYMEREALLTALVERPTFAVGKKREADGFYYCSTFIMECFPRSTQMPVGSLNP